MADIKDYLPKEGEDTEEVKAAEGRQEPESDNLESLVVHEEDDTPEEEPAPEAPEESEPEVPEKYRGKTAEELIKMHADQEKFQSQQAREIGELRRVVDEYLRPQAPPQVAEEPADEVDYWTDPEAAIARHPSVRKAEEQLQRINQAQTAAQLQQKHPDIAKIVNSQEFAQYVQASPMRQRMYREANEGFDIAAADELVSGFKAVSGLNNPRPAQKPDRSSAVKNVDTGASRSAVAKQSKKKLSRAALIELKRTDPEKYEAMADEIYQAYAEGRVK